MQPLQPRLVLIYITIYVPFGEGLALLVLRLDVYGYNVVLQPPNSLLRRPRVTQDLYHTIYQAQSPHQRLPHPRYRSCALPEQYPLQTPRQKSVLGKRTQGFCLP